jgi:hypothetical protein
MVFSSTNTSSLEEINPEKIVDFNIASKVGTQFLVTFLLTEGNGDQVPSKQISSSPGVHLRKSGPFGTFDPKPKIAHKLSFYCRFTFVSFRAHLIGRSPSKADGNDGTGVATAKDVPASRSLLGS